MNRYFEITEADRDKPITVCEYFGDTGLWTYKNNAYRFATTIGNGDTLLISSSYPLTKELVKNTCILIQNPQIVTREVDLKSASNPKNERQPAMKKKGKK
jgi:hypothetical protein